jgi:glycosyltransferase involved in cell wall biosynthesis
VLLEAWANGVPNIAYRAGGVADVVRDREDGLLVRCGDVDRLAAALEELIADPNYRRRLGDAGRERTGKEFRWEERLQRVRGVYEHLTANSQPG